jgi:hypothetical protein
MTNEQIRTLAAKCAEICDEGGGPADVEDAIRLALMLLPPAENVPPAKTQKVRVSMTFDLNDFDKAKTFGETISALADDGVEFVLEKE